MLAAVAYFALHSLASTNVDTPTDVGQLGGIVGRQIYVRIAAIGQYVLPAVLLVAGAISFVKRTKTRRLVCEFTADDGDASRMSWREFEQLVGEIFRRKGYRVAETTNGADGGVDLVLRCDEGIYLVQCKQWRARHVGVKIVRELKGVIAERRAAGGAVVTCGTFTRDAIAFARQAGVDLMDGVALKSFAVEMPAVATAPKAPASALAAASAAAAPVAAASPACPQCGSEMVKRQARRGPKAGAMFWGCRRFPACRGVVES